MPKKPKCVMILSEGPSDRTALAGFFTELYAMIDENIEVFFPVLSEDVINEEGLLETNFNGDITSRKGINKDNILPLILKLFIHPELRKHQAYEYPASVCEVIHLVDIDGVFLENSRIVTSSDQGIKHPYYDVENNTIITRNRDSLIGRNQRKRDNLERMIKTKRLRITMEKDANESKDKPYSVYFFSKDLDHVLYEKPNNARDLKISDARKFANMYYDDPLEMARYFVNHKYASPADNYLDSWKWLMNDTVTLSPKTNINVLVMKLLSKAKVNL